MRWALHLLWALLLSAQVAAQDTSVGTVSGIVWDSLTNSPLAGARVRAPEAAVETTADRRGRFSFFLPEGLYRLEFTHPDVPTWTALLVDGTVEVGAGEEVSVTLGTVSERTVLRRTCGEGTVAVGGVVRDMLTQVPLARAGVRVTGIPGEAREELGRVFTDMSGEFQLCVGDLPGGAIELQAVLGSVTGRVLTVTAEGRRVVPAELNLLVSQPVRMSGTVRDGETREPVEDVQVRVRGTRLATRSRSDGTFLIRGVPPGAVGLLLEHVRYGRREVQVLTESGDSIHVDIDLQDAAIPLEELVVRVRRAPVPERDRRGTRYDGLDREEIEELLPRASTFDELLRLANIPGLWVQSRGTEVCVEAGRRTGAFGQTCHMVIVYLNDVRVSSPTTNLRNIPLESVERIELVSPMEATGRFGQAESNNGALLIYTRAP